MMGRRSRKITTTHRVMDDENNEPTVYAVRLPPEYHPLRSYPAIVVLHGGEGPVKAIEPLGSPGGSPWLYSDRTGVYRAGPAAGVSLYCERTCRRRAGAA